MTLKLSLLIFFCLTVAAIFPQLLRVKQNLPKLNYRDIFQHNFYMPSCHPTNTVKAMHCQQQQIIHIGLVY